MVDLMRRAELATETTSCSSVELDRKTRHHFVTGGDLAVENRPID
jgi:hypothetical protein